MPVARNVWQLAAAPPVNGTQVTIMDSSASTAGVGGGITFRGYFSSDPWAGDFATINGIKENSGNADYASALTFGTRISGGSMTEQMRISSTGNVGIGTTTPTAGS